MRDQTILNALREIELNQGVTILYACESGSRAWGFASPDSDYDVRFIYVRPLDWYLSVSEKRDVLECPTLGGDLDISGWDLRKALGLLGKSNPPLMEWLGSPIVYKEVPRVILELRQLAQHFYSPVSCAYHYLYMARGNFREYLTGEEVWTKKYFYVLRPILAVNWIERGMGVVPTDFHTLLDRLVPGGELRLAIDDLLAQKRAGAEMRRGPRNEVVSRFVDGELERLGTGSFQADKTGSQREELDRFFRKVVKG